MLTWTLLVFVAVAAVEGSEGSSSSLLLKTRCNSTRYEEADTCVQKIFLIGDKSQRFRETLPQMRSYCKQINELQSCVRRFSRECLPELARQVTNLLLYGVKRVNRQYCSSEKGMLRFNEIAKCGNYQLEEKHQCMDDFLNQLRLVEKRTGEEMVEKRIHYFCCYFSDFKSCVMETFEKGGASMLRKRCPKEEDKQSVVDLIGGYGDDAMEMVCGEFGANTDGSKCEELLKVPAKGGKGASDDGKLEKDGGKARSGKSKPPAKGSFKSNKSILPYFVNIFAKLEDVRKCKRCKPLFFH